MENYDDRGGSYPPRPNTLVCIIRHVIGKLNPIIVLFFFKNILNLKTCLPRSKFSVFITIVCSMAVTGYEGMFIPSDNLRNIVIHRVISSTVAVFF